MGESDKSLMKAIKHYQNSIDKYTENRNDYKLQHYIQRLHNLPIQVYHLEKTGVGRTVNSLRKLGGEIGEASKRLVSKWKDMVVAHQEEQDEEEEENDEEEEGEEEENNVEQRSEEDEDEKNSDSNDHEESTRYETSNQRSKSKETSLSPERHKHRSERSETSERKSKHSHHKKEYKDYDRPSTSSKHKSSKHEKNHSHSSKSHEEVKSKSHRSENNESKHRRRNSSDEEQQPKHDLETRYKNSDHQEKNNTDHQEKKSKKRHRSEDYERNKTDNDNSSEKKLKKHKKDKWTDSGDERKRDRKAKEDTKKREKSDTSDKKSSKSKKGPTGIDSNSGASFAEALGMCEPSSSKSTSSNSSSKKKYKEEKVTVINNEKPVVKLIPEVPKPTKESLPESIDIASLLPPITPNYRPLGNVMLSDVQNKRSCNDYDALSTIIYAKNQRTKVYSGNKCGYTKIPSLFELCIRILQDNIDALEYTGGVPYIILKPILEKATPTQLFNMEHHNPYLIDDTDNLWQLHCQKEFRNKHREELESWREMYMRCLDEREAKLKALTANIKQAQDKSTPIRTTKLAYVDDVVKPPRNIARKQKNLVIPDKRPAVTPTSRLNMIASAGGESGAAKIAVPNPGSRAAERSSHVVKPKKAPLMAKSLSLLKNRFKR